MIDAPTVKALIKVVPYTDHSENNYHPTDIVCKSTQVVVHKKSRDGWKTEQDNDPNIGLVIETMKSKKPDTSNMSEDSKRQFRCGLKVFEKYLMVNCRKINFSLYCQYHIGNNH